jgi:hypothetical protein
LLAALLLTGLLLTALAALVLLVLTAAATLLLLTRLLVRVVLLLLLVAVRVLLVHGTSLLESPRRQKENAGVRRLVPGATVLLTFAMELRSTELLIQTCL